MRSDQLFTARYSARMALLCAGLVTMTTCATPPAPCDWQNAFGSTANAQRVQQLRDSLAARPGDTELRYQLARTYLDEMMFDHAVAELTMSARLTPQDPRLYQLLWIAYMKMPKPNEPAALTVLQAGVRALPNNFAIRSLLALHYCDTGDKPDCLAESQQALSLTTKRDEQASIYLLMASADKAHFNEFYDRAKQLDPTTTVARATSQSPTVYVGELPYFYMKTHPGGCERVRRLQSLTDR